MILSSKFKEGGPVTVEYVDVAASEADKKKMRDLSGNSKALPPQFFNGDTYCGVSYQYTASQTKYRPLLNVLLFLLSPPPPRTMTRLTRLSNPTS